jgi:thiamine biosynthesis protein ThiS
MRITINGKETDLPDVCTVAALLAEQRLGGAACAVEVNECLIPKRQHTEYQIRDGDTIEIVTLVGGG